jgi:hypothetical protein
MPACRQAGSWLFNSLSDITYVRTFLDIGHVQCQGLIRTYNLLTPSVFVSYVLILNEELVRCTYTNWFGR